MLEDLIMAACNEAIGKVEEASSQVMGRLAGGIGLGGL
jgi:DNA-binding protein YbaB